MGIITPETGAIENYLWVKAQEGIKLSLEAVSTSQALINSDYAFKVGENLYRPTIEEEENVSLVNILIGSVTSDDNETNFDKTHVVTYNIDCFVRGSNEDYGTSLIPADEVAVQRLHYLCAMVEFGLTKLANFYEGLNSGEVVPGKIDLNFFPVDDSAESGTPYAPARFTFVCKFPYTSQDLEGLVDLSESLYTVNEWAMKYIKT